MGLRLGKGLRLWDGIKGCGEGVTWHDPRLVLSLGFPAHYRTAALKKAHRAQASDGDRVLGDRQHSSLLMWNVP